MKFSCKRDQLIRSINTVSKAVSQKTTIPMLKGILLKVNDKNELCLMASDLDMSIEKRMEVSFEKEGSVIVDAKIFGEIIRKLPDGDIEISLDENEKVNIKTDSSLFTIIGQDPERFPGIGEIENIEGQIVFDKKSLIEMIRKTYFCASPEESKGIITGVLIELKDGDMSMVALDGYRMAVVREKTENKEEKNLIIPANTLYEVSKILSESEEDEDEKVTFVLSEKKCVIILKRTKVIMRLLEGKFLEYKKIIPSENNIKVKVNRRALFDSIERASLFSRAGKNNLVKIGMKENIMNINSNSEEGNVSEDIIISKEGDDLLIGFNSKYLTDALKNIDEDEVIMEFETAVKPCLIKPLEGDSFEYLILPVRIS